MTKNIVVLESNNDWVTGIEIRKTLFLVVSDYLYLQMPITCHNAGSRRLILYLDTPWRELSVQEIFSKCGLGVD